jgi:hypothetical protein
VENQLEKQYMQSMIEDLKSDTAQFTANSRTEELKKQAIELIEMIKNEYSLK